MNYFRWQAEAGRAWLGRKSAEWVTARRPSTMGVWYKRKGREGGQKKINTPTGGRRREMKKKKKK